MPGNEDRASILQGAGDMIFKLVCEWATREQWAEWLRVPLEHAAGSANHNLVKKLLEAGADGSAGWRGCDGKTLLHAAAEGGDAHVVSALIRAGAGADMKAKAPGTGRTPLHVAVVGGKEAAAKTLMLAGADVNARDAKKDTPLHLAIGGGHVALAENLLLRSANPGLKGSKGDYPIHLAIELGQDEMVQTLIQSGAKLSCLTNGLLTPLCLAARQDRVSAVKILLAGGADASFQNEKGYSALHHAVDSNKTFRAIPVLVEAGADTEAKDRLGYTPLSFSTFGGTSAATLALLQLGADIHSKTVDGETPLHLACEYGEADAADVLLRWGADETMVDNYGKTPSRRMPKIAKVPVESRPRLKRLSKLLAHAPQDRAWRRRGFVVMCRAHPERVRLVVEIPDTVAPAVGQPQERPSRRAKTAQVKVEIGAAHIGGAHIAGGGGGGGGARMEQVKVEIGDVNGGGGGSAGSSSGAGRRGGGVGAGFDGVAAWLMGLQNERVFRNIVGFL